MRTFSAIALLPLLLACAEDSTVEAANPAAEFCVAQGGAYDIRESDAGQVGICTLADGSEVDAWEYFRETQSG